MSAASPVAGDPSRAPAVRDMFARIAPGYDRANRLMSFGIDQLWRKVALRELGEPGDVMDLCAGTMDLSQALVPRARSVTAVDFCQEMLDAGQAKAPSVRTICADARAIPLPDASLDSAIAGFGIRNVPEPERAVAEVARLLRPGGTFVVLDFFKPTTLLARLMAGSYNRVVLPILGGLVTGDSAAYRYLADSMGAWSDRASFEATCRAQGFGDVRGFDLFPPIASIVVARTPAARSPS